ncbi:hypothetical protein HY229_03735 [Candidatus Acetothermia bacterium]|nr:hypothetical protein [Candidatus Acetothermia bacterium]MBI3643195.1 hypothetical protein [Candidatus Acetothermia bacterium]
MARIKTEEFSTSDLERQRKVLPIQSISEPGCYVDTSTGHLIRVNTPMLEIGGTVFQGFNSKDAWFVGKIHDDPYLPIDEARIVAANCSFPVNF